MYANQSDNVLPLSELQVSEALAGVMQRVYLWMCLGLLVTATVAGALVYTPLSVLLVGLLHVPLLFWGLLIGEVGLVWWLSAKSATLPVSTARFWFVVYALLNGITLSFIFLAYTASSIALTFVATGGLFGAMGIIGYTTRRDLSTWRSYLLMGLLGLIIASVVNMFLANTTLDWLLTYGGIALFLALTIFDTQRIKQRALASLGAGDGLAVSRIGLLGALSLYLDFVNLFLRLLRLSGRRR